MRTFAWSAKLKSGLEALAIVSALSLSAACAAGDADGYRGIWFDLGQANAYGSKYSGGLGTYTCSHVPMAVYSKAAHKTFFVWGGEPKDKHALRIMLSYFDHATGTVPRPVLVRDLADFNDPHADPSLNLDAQGHIWVMCSQRHKIPGQKYRSRKPYDISGMELVETKPQFAYAATWFARDKGFFLPLTRYRNGMRELYFQTSPDGKAWSEDQLLATEGHYQVNWMQGERFVCAFNWHPKGADSRTNLYVLQTADFGKSWKTINGAPVTLPLSAWPKNEAMIRDFQAEQQLVYTHDINFDLDGNPVILFLTSHGFGAGPDSGPREWLTARWTGREWDYKKLCESASNYDCGCLHIEADGTWRVIGPTEKGPQEWGPGGEMAMWLSRDKGAAWQKTRQLTRNSERNHTYARRPLNAHPDFYAFWADGDTRKPSRSCLYFTNQEGARVWRLPYDMEGQSAKPEVAW